MASTGLNHGTTGERIHLSRLDSRSRHFESPGGLPFAV